MENVPALVQDLALILFCAAIMSLIFKKLNQPVVLGYIVAGFLAGPYMPYTETIVDIESIKTWAEIGVIFILFTLGLEFSFKKLLKIGSAPIIAVVTSLLCMTAIGFGVSAIFGWGTMDGLYLGGMLAMSSTSVIIKSFDDLGLKQQGFATKVFSVLILEDIIAIILMLLFGMMGEDGNVNGEEILSQIWWMVFYLVVWFVSGIYLIPLIIKKAKRFLNNEMLLILSLSLCFIMVILASKAGFSSAFGAFVMGSILAETTESEHIEKVISPIKDLFGAIFFVSVGMMIDPAMLVEHWVPILVLTLVMLILRSSVDSFSFMLGGVSVKESIHCGYSLAQVGEFSFIIAALGVSIGAIEDFLYPIIVSVSVITTFTTPFMIKLADPVSKFVEPLFPEKFKKESTRNESAADPNNTDKNWRNIVKESATVMLIYAVLGIALSLICDTYLYPYLEDVLTKKIWLKIVALFPETSTIHNYLISVDLAKLVTLIIALSGLLLFIKPLLSKGLYDEKFWKIWNDKNIKRAPLVFTIILRYLLAVTIVSSTIGYLYQSTHAVIAGMVFFVILYFISRKKVNKRIAKMENIFQENLNAKEDAKKPKYSGEKLEKNVHLSEVSIPMNSIWCGQTIKEANWGNKFDVHIASIIREGGRLNIPEPNTTIFPGDKIQIIGTDVNLKKFAKTLTQDEYKIPIKSTTIDNILQLTRIAIPENSIYNNTTVASCNIREDFHCMLIGIDRGESQLIKPKPDVEIFSGDVILVVGESNDIKLLQQKVLQ